MIVVRRIMMPMLLAIVLSTGAIAVAAPPKATSASGRILSKVGFDQKLNAPIDLDLHFVDSQGRQVKLGDYFGKKPVILTLGYYQCPMLCTLVFNGVVHSLQGLSFDAVKDYQWVVVSINPKETPQIAEKEKATYMARYAHGGAKDGWHFLVGDQQSIQKLADQVGFRYAYDPAIQQYAHPAGIMVLTPDGHVSRYFFGTQVKSGDLRLGLVEASGGKIGSPVDTLLLCCYRYDPTRGKYGFVIWGAIRIAAVLTVIALAALVGILIYRDRRRTRLQMQQAAGEAHPGAGEATP